MARAALVACVIALAATCLSAAHAGSQALPAGSTFVVRGPAVQYIPPTGSIVGSLSIRVRSVGMRGQALLGELVTVAVEPGQGLTTAQLVRQHALFTITLQAPSPQAILKGAATVRAIVPGFGANGPSGASAAATRGPSPASDGGGSGNGADSNAGGGASGASGDHGSGQSTTDHGGSGQPTDAGSGSHPGNGAGNSNGHK
jgi:hypothetical protein